MEIWTSFFLGLVGSLHCAGMCGPLALALPVTGSSRAVYLLGRLAYNAGRVVTYGVLGAVCGAIGQTAALAGWQRWLSLGAGMAILLGLIASTRIGLAAPVTRAVGSLKTALSSILRRRSLGALLVFGSLNGLLPCGLVYVACAGAAATGAIGPGIEHMLAFGAGTVPLMLGMSLAGRVVHRATRFRYQRAMPAAVALVGVLLVLRGLALGIPWLSPDLAAGPDSCCR
jgi:sulfite exporter TauE/SafE